MTTTFRPTRCSVCGRRVGKNRDNWCPINETYIHTRCWFKARPAAIASVTKKPTPKPARSRRKA